MREQMNILLLPAERAESAHRHADVRARQPEAAFDRAFALGRAFTRDDAIRAALALRQSS